MRSPSRSLRAAFVVLLLLSGLVATAAPASATPASTAKSISQGGHQGCAVTNAATLKCWGNNTYGQLGIGSDLTDHRTPVLVPGLSGVKQVSAGDFHTCAILARGKLKCWGSNQYGQVGNSASSGNVLVPTQVTGMRRGVKSVSAGYEHTCALLTDGKVKCWGNNADGQVGTGVSGNEYDHPVQVSGILSGATQVSAQTDVSCATINGRAKCWGDNDYGQIGDGTQSTDRLVPKQVSGLTSGVKSVKNGYYNTCALLVSGSLKCWGGNNEGEVGDGTFGGVYLVPTQVLGMTNGVTSYDPGFTTCAVRNGAAKCWGNNDYLQIDNTATDRYAVPTQVAFLTSGVTKVDVGWYSGCALLTSGQERCWGDNSKGEVGNGSLTLKIQPPQMVLL